MKFLRMKFFPECSTSKKKLRSGRDPAKYWRSGRGDRQWSAKPSTPVRLRSAPPIGRCGTKPPAFIEYLLCSTTAEECTTGAIFIRRSIFIVKFYFGEGGPVRASNLPCFAWRKLSRLSAERFGAKASKARGKRCLESFSSALSRDKNYETIFAEMLELVDNTDLKSVGA